MSVKKITAALLALCTIVVIQASFIPDAQAQDRYDRRIAVINNTSWNLERFYATNVSIRGWGRDLLGRYIIPSGSNRTFNIDDQSGYCRFDLKAVFEDGEEVTEFGFDACSRSYWGISD